MLAYFDTAGVSNGGTEAIKLIVDKVRRLAHGFGDFDHNRLPILLAASGQRAYHHRPNHARFQRAGKPLYEEFFPDRG